MLSCVSPSPLRCLADPRCPAPSACAGRRQTRYRSASPVPPPQQRLSLSHRPGKPQRPGTARSDATVAATGSRSLGGPQSGRHRRSCPRIRRRGHASRPAGAAASAPWLDSPHPLRPPRRMEPAGRLGARRGRSMSVRAHRRGRYRPPRTAKLRRPVRSPRRRRTCCRQSMSSHRCRDAVPPVGATRAAGNAADLPAEALPTPTASARVRPPGRSAGHRIERPKRG